MTKENEATRRPTHIVWQVIGEGENAFWTRLGAGWLNRDGKGISLRLDAVALTGRTVIRENDAEGGHALAREGRGRQQFTLGVDDECRPGVAQQVRDQDRGRFARPAAGLGDNVAVVAFARHSFAIRVADETAVVVDAEQHLAGLPVPPRTEHLWCRPLSRRRSLSPARRARSARGEFFCHDTSYRYAGWNIPSQLMSRLKQVNAMRCSTMF